MKLSIVLLIALTNSIFAADSSTVTEAKAVATSCDARFLAWRDARDKSTASVTLPTAAQIDAPRHIKQPPGYQGRFTETDKTYFAKMSSFETTIKSQWTILSTNNPLAGAQYPYPGVATLESLSRSCVGLHMLITVQSLHDTAGSEPTLPFYPH